MMDMRLFSVKLKLDDGTTGWPDEAPFDRIIVTAGGPEVPQPLVDQLADNGRMLIPVGDTRRHQSLKLVVKKDGKTEIRDMGGVAFVDLVGRHGW